MSDIDVKFGWLSGAGPLGSVFGVSFVRGLAPREALVRLGVDESTIDEMTFEELDENAEECLESSDGIDAGWAGAVRMGDWTVLVEPGGWRVAAGTGVLERLSQGAEVVAVSRHDYASDDFAHAIDGRLITQFEPLASHLRSGDDPDRWIGAMRDLGLGLNGFDDPLPEDPIGAAFALAGVITGVDLSPALLEMTFLAGTTNPDD
ncbi:DUF6461 domain-containing protein [Microbispora bryophytorum]|nr:DUF6461 domain-containing protein [Microbispora bryophytorum]MBD3138974.1 hypothetical protein [Microbispora bryophytorum]TQS10222.1 hypothetical protein FLX07_04230 [Microbispora bryophytorum]